MRREEWLKVELLSKKKARLKDLENSQPIYIAKMRKCVWKTTLRMSPNDHLIRLIWIKHLNRVMCYSSRQWKYIPKRISEIIRAAISVTDQSTRAQGTHVLPPRFQRMGLPRAVGCWSQLSRAMSTGPQLSGAVTFQQGVTSGSFHQTVGMIS